MLITKKQHVPMYIIYICLVPMTYSYDKFMCDFSLDKANIIDIQNDLVFAEEKEINKDKKSNIKRYTVTLVCVIICCFFISDLIMNFINRRSKKEKIGISLRRLLFIGSVKDKKFLLR